MEEIEVFVLIRCDEKTELSQKLNACTRVENEIKKINGVQRTYFTGKQQADITLFAKWDKADIEKYVQQIKKIEGVKEVDAKLLLPA